MSKMFNKVLIAIYLLLGLTKGYSQKESLVRNSLKSQNGEISWQTEDAPNEKIEDYSQVNLDDRFQEFEKEKYKDLESNIIKSKAVRNVKIGRKLKRNPKTSHEKKSVNEHKNSNYKYKTNNTSHSKKLKNNKRKKNGRKVQNKYTENKKSHGRKLKNINTKHIGRKNKVKKKLKKKNDRNVSKSSKKYIKESKKKKKRKNKLKSLKQRNKKAKAKSKKKNKQKKNKENSSKQKVRKKKEKKKKNNKKNNDKHKPYLQPQIYEQGLQYNGTNGTNITNAFDIYDKIDLKIQRQSFCVFPPTDRCQELKGECINVADCVGKHGIYYDCCSETDKTCVCCTNDGCVDLMELDQTKNCADLDGTCRSKCFENEKQILTGPEGCGTGDGCRCCQTKEKYCTALKGLPQSKTCEDSGGVCRSNCYSTENQIKTGEDVCGSGDDCKCCQTKNAFCSAMNGSGQSKLCEDSEGVCRSNCYSSTEVQIKKGEDACGIGDDCKCCQTINNFCNNLRGSDLSKGKCRKRGGTCRFECNKNEEQIFQEEKSCDSGKLCKCCKETLPKCKEIDGKCRLKCKSNEIKNDSYACEDKNKCCVPEPAVCSKRVKKQCDKTGGKCLPPSDCDGKITPKNCKDKLCCCVASKTCKTSNKCKKNDGTCQSSSLSCEGETNDSFCKGSCTCCLSKQKCVENNGECRKKCKGNKNEFENIYLACDKSQKCCVKEEGCTKLKGVCIRNEDECIGGKLHKGKHLCIDQDTKCCVGKCHKNTSKVCKDKRGVCKKKTAKCNGKTEVGKGLCIGKCKCCGVETTTTVKTTAKTTTTTTTTKKPIATTTLLPTTAQSCAMKNNTCKYQGIQYQHEMEFLSGCSILRCINCVVTATNRIWNECELSVFGC